MEMPLAIPCEIVALSSTLVCVLWVCITLYLSLFSADKIDVMRDIFAYMVVLAIIIGVAYDGTVKHYHVFSYSAKFLDGL